MHAPTAAPPVAPKLHPFTTEDYRKMIELGILTDKDRVELIEGAILTMSPINAKHAGIVNRLGRLLRGLEPQQGLLSIQNPLRVDEMSEPEPDIAVLKPREDDYYESLPRPEDVLLLIEVADSSLKYDLGVKADLYAKAGIGEYWVVDLVNNGLIVHRDPTADGYRSLRTMEKDKTAVAQAFPELSIEMNELLP